MRLGFLGVGWIGRHRLAAIAHAGVAEIAAIADPSRDRLEAAATIAPGAVACSHLGQLLELPLDGIVIATPSALHADQCIAALDRGIAVFCQKPLARTASETRRVVDTARTRDRLLGVDLSYRHVTAVQRIRDIIPELGPVFALDLVFHNAYGPEASWFYDRAASGGGCVIDLGVHLVDLALWLMGDPAIDSVASRLFTRGQPIAPDQVEDYAEVQLRLAGGAVARLACSWRVSAGCDALIGLAVYGTNGGAAVKNVAGSFYDFVAERYRGTQTERLAGPPDDWGGRAAIAWAEQLARSNRFDPEAHRLVALAGALDAIYGAAR